MKISMNAMASLALFRQFYNDGKKDILTVLAEFIKKIISKYGKKAFSITEVKNKLMDDYEFYIPDAIIASALKKFCTKENNLFQVNDDFLFGADDANVFETEKNENNKILNDLIVYVGSKIGEPLNQDDKALLTQSFCEYLLEDDTSEKFLAYISSFMLEQEKNVERREQLKKIKEGVILYAGIKYNDSVTNMGGWNSKLTIYVEQEILFSLAGYHGALLQEIHRDFLKLVREINMKASKNLIQIKYFKDVKNGIERYFEIAEDIVNGKKTLNTSKQAMLSIVDGCQTATDVIRKKVEFYKCIADERIEEEVQSFDVVGNEMYNIESDQLVTQLITDWKERNGAYEEEQLEGKIVRSLKYLNYISIERRGKEGSINNVSSILLTQTSRTLFIACHPSVKVDNICPLATTVDFLTNLFWLKLNKGFGQTSFYPRSFDFVIRAKIVLSSMISQSISNEFDRLKKEREEGRTPPDLYVAELAELKMKMRRPDDITVQGIDDALEAIKMTDIERYIREKQIAQRDAEKKDAEKKKIIARLNNEKDEMTEKIKSMEEKMKTDQSVIDDLKKESDEQKRSYYTQMIKRKTKADCRVSKKILVWKIGIALSFVILYVLVVFLIKKFGWNDLEPVTYVLGLLSIILNYIIFIFIGKTFNPIRQIPSFLQRQENTYKQKLYDEEDIDLDKMNRIKKELENKFDE